jgi:hypothetical protein
LRLVAEPHLLAWDWPRILRETFEWQSLSWDVGGRRVGLPLTQGVVPARTMFLSGTPDDVVLQSPSARHIFLGSRSGSSHCAGATLSPSSSLDSGVVQQPRIFAAR